MHHKVKEGGFFVADLLNHGTDIIGRFSEQKYEFYYIVKS